MYAVFNFRDSVEIVLNDDWLGDEYPKCSSTLGDFVCKILSVNYRELSKTLATLLCDSLSNGSPYPEKAISDTLCSYFGKLDFDERKKVETAMRKYRDGFLSPDSSSNEILARWGETPFSYIDRFIYQTFARLIVLQCYLEESISNKDMRSHTRFEQFIIAAYEDRVHLLRQECEYLYIGDYSIVDSDVYPDDVSDEPLREKVLEIFDNVWSAGEIASFKTKSLLDLITSVVYYFFMHGLFFKRCQNCGKFFVPFKRSDELYCNNPSPQDATRTCKEYGKDRLWYENMKKDEVAVLARRVYSKKQMMARRHPDLINYKDAFERFKIGKKEWEKAIKRGERTAEDYKTWLLEMDSRKY